VLECVGEDPGGLGAGADVEIVTERWAGHAGQTHAPFPPFLGAASLIVELA
jgi:hypothetical protein